MTKGVVHVVGGGLAGLAAALDLLDAGRAVEVHEASPHLGGRCRSYHDPKLDRLIDNGTHALAGANPAALAMLERLGARGRWAPADEDVLRVADLAAGVVRPVAPPTLGALLWPRGGAADLATPGRADLLGLARTLLGPDRPVASLYLTTSPFYREVIDPLTVAALNTHPDEASSKLLAAVLRASLRGRDGLSPLMPLIARDGLGPDLVDPLAEAVRAAGGHIMTGRRIDRLLVSDGRVAALVTGAGEIALGSDDAACLAVPPHIAARLLRDLEGVAPPEIALDASPIVNAHFITSAPIVATPRMVGVLGGAAQWIALRGDMASITVSAADDLARRPGEEVLELLWDEVTRACALLHIGLAERPTASRLVKERWATLRQTPGLARPPARAPGLPPKIVLAGDWTRTGLPFTIESAIRSGRNAANALTR